MFYLYEFYIEYTNPVSGQKQFNGWIYRGGFSQLVDAEAQLQRFINAGIPPENLKIEQEPAP